ncbi:MAG: DUF484 family protein [Magnetovibrionaceae bacterium]
MTKQLLEDEPALPTEEEVRAYLKRNPDFLARNTDLIGDLVPPDRSSGSRVIDLQRFQVAALQDEMGTLRATTAEVIGTQRDNLNIQSRVHEAVLALLATTTEAGFLRVTLNEWPMMLDVDVVSICFEHPNGGSPVPMAETDGELRPLPAGYQRMILDGAPARLFEDFSDDGTLFGAGSTLVRSVAFARIGGAGIGQEGHLPPGLLCLGSRSAGTFDQAQGTELLSFLARVVEQMLIAWSRRRGD